MAMAKKMEIKVTINCQTCKSDVLKAVTKLTGVDEVSVNGEKGILTVIGDVDPFNVMKNLKKINKSTEIMTVAPPKPSQPKKPDPPKKIQVPDPSMSICCHFCEDRVPYVPIGYYEDVGGCTIL